MQFMVKNERKSLLKGELVCAVMWFIYGVFIGSYAEMIAETILFISTLIQLIKSSKVNKV